MDVIKEKAYAKINLALSIVGKKDGYHLIDSLVREISICDKIIIKKRNDEKIKVIYTNLEKDIENDISYRTAKYIKDTYNTGGVEIEIEKNIPFSAGLGGSSADAAGIARGMKTLFSLNDISKEILLKLGSDVPYMYEGGDKRLRGKGEILESVSLPELYIVILVCEGGVNTKEAYTLYDKIGGENYDIDEVLKSINEKKPYRFCNALERAAMRINSNIKEGKNMLKKAGFSKIVMTGSGSSVLGIEEDKKDFQEKYRMLAEINDNKYKIIIA